MDILDYITSNGNENERFDFDNHDDAKFFGDNLREIIKQEGYSDCMEVDISVTTVRVKVLAEAAMAV